jgi:hypothetical protein
MREKAFPSIRFVSIACALLAGVAAGGIGLAQDGPVRDSVPFDLGQLSVLQNLPTGKWRQVTRSSMAGRNSLGQIDPRLADLDETHCATAEQIQQSLIALSPRGCPFSVQADFGTEARLTLSCPSQTVVGITLPALTIPVKISRPTTAQDRVIEVRERTVRGDKFITSTLTYLGDCD